MKFVYFNDTRKQVYIHPATFDAGVWTSFDDKHVIAPLETQTFYMLEGNYPFVKMWDHGSFFEIYVRAEKDGD